MPFKPYRPWGSGAAAVALLTPGLAHANLSHVSGGGVVLLSVFVLAALAGIPALAALTAERGRRRARFAQVLGVWILLIVLAIAIPTGQYGGASDSAITRRILIAAVALVVAIVAHRLHRRFAAKARAAGEGSGKED